MRVLRLRMLLMKRLMLPRGSAQSPAIGDKRGGLPAWSASCASIAATTGQSSSPVRSHLNPQVVYASSMAQSAKKILKQALLLPDKERAEVIAELLESLPPSDPAESRSDEEWIAEVERRARAALAGSASLSWEQARMQIRERLERK